jgi:hypothetical protein
MKPYQKSFRYPSKNLILLRVHHSENESRYNWAISVMSWQYLSTANSRCLACVEWVYISYMNHTVA